MKKNNIEALIELRKQVIGDFNKLRYYKDNPNALMKERDHAMYLSEVIKRIDNILKEHVTFS